MRAVGEPEASERSESRPGVSGGSNVFISYSRTDQSFVARLTRALKDAGRDSWVDWEGIAPSAEWMAEIREAIDAADSFVFVMSSASLSSDVCEEEVEHAVGAHKRIVPIVRHEVGTGVVPEALAKLNWVFFRDSDDFDASFAALLQAIDTDLERVKLHTRLLVRAREWSAAGEPRSKLLRGADLAESEAWASSPDRTLPPTEDQQRYVLASRRAASRRQRLGLAAVAGVLALSITLTSLALVQRGHARDAQTAAEAQALRSDAERLGTLAQHESALDRSLLLGVAAIRLQDLAETRGDLFTILQEEPGLIRLIHTGGSTVNSVAIRPDGRLLASGDSAGVVHFHDLRTWEPSGEAVRLEGSISLQALVFSPGGRTLAAATAAAGRANLYLIDVASRTSKQIGSWRSIPASAGPLRFTHLAYSPDGSRIAVAVATSKRSLPFPVSERLLLLEATTGRVVWERTYPLGTALNEATVEFTPLGALVTSAQNGETLLWDTRAGRIQRRFELGGPFALSPDGRLAAIARNNEDPSDPNASLAVLDLQSGQRRFLQDLPDRAWIVDLQFTPDGERVVGADFNGGLRVWNLSSGQIVQTFTGGLSVAVTPDGRTVLSEGVAWDLSGEQRLGGTFRWNDSNHGCSNVPCFVIDPQGTLMASDQGDGTVALIDLRTRQPIDTLRATEMGQANALAFFPDGRTLATGDTRGTVTLWDVRTRSSLQTLQFSDPVWFVAVSPDGRLLAVQTQARDSSSSSVEVRVVDSGEVLYVETVPNGKGGVSFSPDGRRLAVLGCCQPESTVEVWDARSGQELFSPDAGGQANSIAFSPDGRLLGAGTKDGKVVLWNARNGELVGPPIQAAAAAISPISFSPDGRLFVVSSLDQTVTLWDIASRKRIGNTFPIEPAVIPAAYFAPNGDVVIDYLAKAAVWPTDLQTWVRFACQAAGRDLTRAEWQELLPDRPYQHVCAQ